ncbi:MAG TPA: aldo/keto reductase [Aliidongia sp.]|nr:aldo/keto reductase [Aliidongia sp.]
MNRRILGTTGVEISRIILGCGTFGGIGGAKALVGRGLDRAGSFATLDESLALGINVLDTAERYADGESERMTGEWLRRQPAAVRADLHIATKVAPPFADGDAGRPFDRAYIEAKLARSLERLGVESVTFYLSHGPDPETPIEATLEGFAAAVESGRVRHIGCCNVDADQLRAALAASDRLGLPAFEWVQNSFSLLDPAGYREVRALCAERGLGFTPFSPLAGGVLSGKYKRDEPFPEGTRMALRPEGVDKLLSDAVFDALDRLGAEAARRGISTAALALAWILAHPDCTAPVIGPSRAAPHLGHAGEAMKAALTPEDAAEIASWFSPG